MVNLNTQYSEIELLDFGNKFVKGFGFVISANTVHYHYKGLVVAQLDTVTNQITWVDCSNTDSFLLLADSLIPVMHLLDKIEVA